MYLGKTNVLIISTVYDYYVTGVTVCWHQTTSHYVYWKIPFEGSNVHKIKKYITQYLLKHCELLIYFIQMLQMRKGRRICYAP